MPELITPNKFSLRGNIKNQKFSLRGNIKNQFCQEKHGMYFAETIYGGKGYGWKFSKRWGETLLIYVITYVKL